MDRFFKPALFFLVVSYLISIIGLIMKIDEPEYFRVSWVFTTLSFVILMLFHSPHTLRFWTIIIFTGLAGFLIEVVGVNTGLIFGQYSYGDSLGLKVWNTPLVMLINWMMLPYLVYTIISKTKYSTFVKILFSSAILTGFDAIMEPVAIMMNMWRWQNLMPPLHNSIGWFVVSFILFTFLYYSNTKVKNRLAPYLLLIQVLFFATLNVIFRIL